MSRLFDFEVYDCQSNWGVSMYAAGCSYGHMLVVTELSLCVLVTCHVVAAVVVQGLLHVAKCKRCLCYIGLLDKIDKILDVIFALEPQCFQVVALPNLL